MLCCGEAVTRSARVADCHCGGSSRFGGWKGSTTGLRIAISLINEALRARFRCRMTPRSAGLTRPAYSDDPLGYGGLAIAPQSGLFRDRFSVALRSSHVLAARSTANRKLSARLRAWKAQAEAVPLPVTASLSWTGSTYGAIDSS